MGYLESWVASGAQVMLQSQLLDLDMGICSGSSQNKILSSRVIAGITFSVITTISLLCILVIIAGLHFKHGIKQKVSPQLQSSPEEPPAPHPPHFLPPLEVTPFMPETTLRMPPPLPSLEECVSTPMPSFEMSTPPLSLDFIPPFLLSSEEDPESGQPEVQDPEVGLLSSRYPTLLTAAESLQTLSTDFRL